MTWHDELRKLDIDLAVYTGLSYEMWKKLFLRGENTDPDERKADKKLFEQAERQIDTLEQQRDRLMKVMRYEARLPEATPLAPTPTQTVEAEMQIGEAGEETVAVIDDPDGFDKLARAAVKKTTVRRTGTRGRPKASGPA